MAPFAKGQGIVLGEKYFVLKQIKVPVQDSILLDSNTIVENTVKIIEPLGQLFQSVNHGKTIVLTRPFKSDSVTVAYKSYAIDFNRIFTKRKIDDVSTYMGSEQIRFTEFNKTTSSGLVNFGDMDYSGSLSRGLSFGNNQDVVLNSQFNLQLSGYVGDSIRILGSLTDNNIPFQPEGNTQKIQEFDKIYLELNKRKTKIIAGDYDLQRPNSYFMNFYKRVQGINFSDEAQLGKHVTYNYGLGASLAKGKFVRQAIIPIEGNQGPYKLVGPNGETFFIILANSDRIFIDGIQLQRGEDKDYIIDYNQAEIVFMPRKMITKDSRIIVEYEFNDRYYLNSLLFTAHELKIGQKHHIRLFGYSNQDARNQSAVQQDLSVSQKFFLGTIGDDLEKAKYSSARLDTFNANRVLYKLIDTTFQGINYDSVYVYSTHPDSAKYSLAFTYVGEGKGHYRPAANLANGRVYEWLPLNNGSLQGNYEPFVTLVTPKRIQMFALAGTYNIDSGKAFTYDIALSNNDPNLFSKIDNNKHLGIATKLGWQQYLKLKKNHGLQTNLNYELVQKSFNSIERFRTAEFTRDWNVTFNPPAANEHIGGAQIAYVIGENLKLFYNLNTYFRGATSKSLRNEIGFTKRKANKFTEVIANITNGRDNNSTFYYLRPSVQSEQLLPLFKGVIAGIKCSLENNQTTFLSTDSLTANSFAFGVARAYIKNRPDAKNIFELDYFARQDQLPNNNVLGNATLSHNFSASTQYKITKLQSLNFNTSFRKLFIQDSTLYTTRSLNDNNLLARVQYDASYAKKSVQYNLIYELGNGQELRRAFTYLEVPQGQGVYAWRDYNNDNIQQLNEFELAVFQDQKKFIRVFTPTNQYIAAKYNLLNSALIFQPKLLLPSKYKDHWVGKFTFQSSVSLSNKLVNDNSLNQYNPFIRLANDTGLIAKNTTMNNSIYFNRFSTIWGVDYTNTYNVNRSLLTYGIDTRTNQEHNIKGRFNITKQWMFNMLAKIGNQSFLSPFLDSRSFDYDYFTASPAITFLKANARIRLVWDGKFEQRLNEIKYGGERTFIRASSIEAKYNTANSNSLSTKFSYNNISFNGNTNSSVGYILLDGLLPGNNYLWQFNYDRKVGNGVEIGIEYEGRKSGINPIVHIGRAVARAIF
jgi:hypothetical protein